MSNELFESILKLLNKVVDYFGRTWTKRIAKIMILGGITIIGSASSPVWFPFAQAIIERFISIDISPYMYTTNYILMGLGFLIILLGFTLIVLDMYFAKNGNINKTNEKVLELRHTSIEGIVDFDVDTLNQSIVVVNQNNNMRRGTKESIIEAVNIQCEKTNEIMALLNVENYNKIEYKGLAHIPLTFLAGYQMSDKFSPVFYEWNQSEKNWQLIDACDVEYPKLICNHSTLLNPQSVDVAIKLGITYEVDNKDLFDTKTTFKVIYSLSLENPKRNVIKSKIQLSDYKKQFRGLIDEINQQYLDVKNIHIFFSGQPSLAFSLGSSLSERMDANVYVYNHNRKSKVSYSWGIKMQKVYRDGCVVFTDKEIE